ncbi:MAG: hypothetical protein IKT40_10270 [Bacilli bacterium]|nr:hypothetical protein [Bacilli bacterium]
MVFKSIALVKAGRAGTILPTNFKEVNADGLQHHLKDVKEDQMYCVVGESMSPEGIHTDNILVAEKIESKDDVKNILKQGDFVIIRIPKNKDDIVDIDLQRTLSLKIRKYITVLDLNVPYEQLWNDVQDVDDLSKIESSKDIFKLKYDQAIKSIPPNDRSEVLLSITYTAEHGREYSFHSRKFLYAKVVFYIDSNKKKIILK